jgi:pyruvate formate lyase activating enzyme
MKKFWAAQLPKIFSSKSIYNSPMLSGLLFDLREFSLHDGPGIRTTVFLKGCPLRCQWCHNPEGQSPRPQTLTSPAGPRQAGASYTSAELAAYLNRQAAILQANEGGVTFSGGEPLMQAAFVAEVIDQLEGIHVLLDTCGYSSPFALRWLLGRVQLVYYDLKLIDPAAARRYTGLPSAPILQNLHLLARSGVPYVIRIPLVPGVTDTDANLSAIAALLLGLPGLQEVHLLPYNPAAGAKYPAAGMTFRPEYDESRPLAPNLSVFDRLPVKVKVL